MLTFLHKELVLSCKFSHLFFSKFIEFFFCHIVLGLRTIVVFKGPLYEIRKIKRILKLHKVYFGRFELGLLYLRLNLKLLKCLFFKIDKLFFLKFFFLDYKIFLERSRFLGKCHGGVLRRRSLF